MYTFYGTESLITFGPNQPPNATDTNALATIWTSGVGMEKYALGVPFLRNQGRTLSPGVALSYLNHASRKFPIYVFIQCVYMYFSIADRFVDVASQP